MDNNIYARIGVVKPSRFLGWLILAIIVAVAISAAGGFRDDALGVVLTLTLYGAALVWSLRALQKVNVSFRQLMGLETFSWRKLLYLLWIIPFATFGLALYMLSFDLVSRYFPEQVLAFVQITSTMPERTTVSGVFLLLFAFTAVPIIEELMFRGVIFNSWSVRWGVKRAIIFSALLFAIAHFQINPWHVLAAILTCVLYMRIGGLWFSVLEHAIGNAIVSAYVFLSPSTIVTLHDIQGYTIAYSIAVAVSAPFVICFFYHYWPLLPERRGDDFRSTIAATS